MHNVGRKIVIIFYLVNMQFQVSKWTVTEFIAGDKVVAVVYVEW